MKFTIPKRHLAFSIAYFVTLVVLMLNEIEQLPMAETLRKIKYPYIFFVFFLLFFSGKIKRGIKAALMVMLLYIAHSILFGFVFVNSLVADQIYDNATRMLWFLAFVLVTFLYVSQHDFFKEFITLSYLAGGTQLFVGLITHRNNVVNPLWGLVHAFTATDRFRNDFGFRHAGYTSNACFTVLAISLFFFEMHRHTDEIKKARFWITFLLIDGIAGIELMSAAERAGIICTFIVFGIYIVFVFFRVRIELKTLLFFMAVAVLAGFAMSEMGVFADAWGKSNRELNISVNYPLFKAYGDPLTGLGFIESAGFQKERALFPMPTSSLDMYYVYIYFSTGLIGILMVGLALVIILVKVIVNKHTNINLIGLVFYLAMLFYAIWQCDLYTHRYISSHVTSVIFLCIMSKDCCMGEDKCLSTESMA